MRKSKLIAFVLLFVLFSQAAISAQIRYVGLEKEEMISLENDMIWYNMRMKKESVFYKIMRADLENTSGISLAEAPIFIYQHFPLVMSNKQEVRRCPSPSDVCSTGSVPFSDWDVILRSDQILPQSMFKLYTPYLDRNHETTIIGFSPERLLSVKDKNQTIAVIERSAIGQSENRTQEYDRWVRFSQWMALAKLHHIFSSDGQALKECTTNEGSKYLCDPYANGSMYIASLALTAGSEDCVNCTDNEKIMLKIIAFDHALRTGKDEASDKVVQFLKGSLGDVLKSDSKQIKALMEIYNTRNEDPTRGLVN